MTTARRRAAEHCAHMDPVDRELFLLGFDAGLKAEKAGEDTAQVLRGLLFADDTASAAGFLEGIAASRPQRTTSRCRVSCTHRFCRHVRREQAIRDSIRHKAVA